MPPGAAQPRGRASAGIHGRRKGEEMEEKIAGRLGKPWGFVGRLVFGPIRPCWPAPCPPCGRRTEEWRLEGKTGLYVCRKCREGN